MENWPTVVKILVSCTGLSLIFSFFSLLFSGISARATVATVQNAPERKRFTVYVHFAAVALVLVTTGYGGVLYFSNSPAVSASSTEPTTVACPCAGETKQRNEDPPRQPERIPNTSSSSVEVQATPFKKSMNFLIDSIRYDYSHNALMGKFSGKLFIENGSVKFVSPHPVFRLAGRHEIWGQRTITGIKIGIADYDELIKVSRGDEGDVTWSDPFELTATRDHGEEYPENKTIELSVPVGMTDLKGKAVIVQIDNKLTSSGKTLEPSYAISGREIFSGSLSSQQSVNNQTRRKRVPIRRRNSC